MTTANSIQFRFIATSLHYENVWRLRGPALWLEFAGDHRPVLSDRCGWYTLTGAAALLVAEGTPIGILLDRLQECPEECAAPEAVVLAAVEWLRVRHPFGT